MRVSVRSIRRREVAAVRRLVQLYIYDLGGERWGVEPDGTFGSPGWHRRFWTRRGRHHFVIRVGGRLAGFALVSERAHFAGAGVREISEFFVLRCYRRRGVGTHAARRLFARFPGRWELAVLTWNVGARRFWRGLVRRCAVGAVAERRRRHGDLAFFVQHFATATGRPRRPPKGRTARIPARPAPGL
jgi:predicted acetyltransferase